MLLLQLLITVGASTHFWQILAAPTNEVKEEAGVTERLFQQMDAKMNISNGFANTTIMYKVKNIGENSKNCTFSIVVPQDGVITGFTMEVDGRKFPAYATGPDAAKIDFDKIASSNGSAAGHVAVNVSNSNLYDMTLHIPSHTEVVFYLTYKTPIKRINNWAELIFDIRPGQFLKNLTVEVSINEDSKIIKVVPFSVDVLETDSKKYNYFNLDSEPTVFEKEMGATVKFTLVSETQKRLDHLKQNGFSKQFVIRYEIETDPLVEKKDIEFIGNRSQLLNEMVLSPGYSLVVHDVGIVKVPHLPYSSLSMCAHSRLCTFCRIG